jgi:hypothetical protein
VVLVDISARQLIIVFITDSVFGVPTALVLACALFLSQVEAPAGSAGNLP